MDLGKAHGGVGGGKVALGFQTKTLHMGGTAHENHLKHGEGKPQLSALPHHGQQSGQAATVTAEGFQSADLDTTARGSFKPRYQAHKGDDAGIALDFRRMGTESEVSDYASPVIRTDWALRGRMRLADGLVGEAYLGKSSHEVEDERDAYELEGGSRSQQGLRLGYSRTGLWARGEYRRYGGDDLPANRLDLSGGVSRPGFGGVSADMARGSWTDLSTSSTRVRAWTEPLLGVLSLFASREGGTYGAGTTALLEATPPAPDSTTDEGGEPAEPAE